MSKQGQPDQGHNQDAHVWSLASKCIASSAAETVFWYRSGEGYDMAQAIAEREFADLCRRAWTGAEDEVRQPCNKFSRGVPVLFVIKNELLKLFDLHDDIEGIYRIQDAEQGEKLPESQHETFEEAYLRKIGELLTDRMSQPFDYRAVIAPYLQQANLYDREEARLPQKTRKRLTTGRRFSKLPPR